MVPGFQGSMVSRLPCETLKACHVETRVLALAELEALAGALLPVLLSFLAARIARDHAFGLELLAQFGIELHQRASQTQLHRVGLSIDSATRNVGNHVEVACCLGGNQGLPCTCTLRLGHEVLVERAAVDLVVSTARTKINARHRSLAAACSVILNQISHSSFEL